MIRRLLPLALLLLSASLYLGAARATNPPGAAADHFLAYKTKPPRGAPPFVTIASARLADRFDDRLYDVTKVRDLLVPASVEGDAIADAATHLQAYAIKASKVCSDDGSPCAKAAECGAGAKCKRPAYVKRLGQTMVDAFGPRVVDVVKPDLVLVPSAKSLSSIPPAPDPLNHAVDHFTCYKAKITKRTAGLPKGTQILLADQLTTPAKRFVVKALTHLCAPAQQNGAAVENPTGHLLCYTAKPAKGEPKHAKRLAVGINNQFGPLTRDTAAETTLCIPAAPATVLATPTSLPSGGGIATPTPSPTGSPGIPPDPGSVAPPVENAVASTVFDSTAFLYTGPNPIQTGVAPGTIELTRAAVIRGKVVDPVMAPLVGVVIRILDHPEFGQTMSRMDGMFDMVVNGGGLLTVTYERAGFLPAQRTVDVPWQDYVTASDVMLMAPDPVMTMVDLGANDPMQVARGTAMSDADGSRRATIFFPQGTTAEMVMPDGSTSPMPAIGFRATEYTVGPNGPMAMPGELPAASGYTYAVELSADQAMAAGAAQVRFNQPLPFYVENFIGFTTGTWVPTGYYDRQLGRWVASDSGRVIEILGITGSVADVDYDGDGVAEDAAGLADAGITEPERQRLATLYQVGQTLWRVPITHFTPWDCNFPFGPPPDSGPPCPTCKPKPPDKRPNDPCKRRGSIIECQSQTFGEAVPVAGTGLELHYRSSRAVGRRAANRLEIRLTGDVVPPPLQGVILEIAVGGRVFKEAFAPAPNLTHTFVWDGKDAYGRPLLGRQPASVRIGYQYLAQYYATPSEFADSFNRFGSPPLTRAVGVSGGGGGGGGGAVAFDIYRTNVRQTSPPITLFTTYETELGVFDARAHGLGGWTLGNHHVYDVGAQELLLGNGGRRSVDGVSRTIDTIAGSGSSSQEGIPAEQATLAVVNDVAVAPDGSIYLAHGFANLVRRIDAEGVITTVAGTGAHCSVPTAPCGDGGPATAAQLNLPLGIALAPDGALYIADFGSGRIRRVDASGTITTIAGNGSFSYPDGVPALATGFKPTTIAVGPDGSVYVDHIDSFLGSRVRRVGPDGIVTTVAGGAGAFGGAGCSSQSDPCGDGGLATDAVIVPTGLATGPDGSVYIADDSLRRVRRVTPDGVITTIAGTGAVCPLGGPCGDGGPAVAATLSVPRQLDVTAAGTVYIVDFNAGRVRVVTPDGIIRTAAGRGGFDPSDGDGGFARAASLPNPQGVAVTRDGTLYVANTKPGGGSVLREAVPVLPGLQSGELLIADDGGGELYVFDATGRHQRTLDSLTGAVRYQFTYDGDGRLLIVTDDDGNVTTVERDGGGNPLAIVAPFGQRTDVSLDANGYLASVTNPAGEAFEMVYTADGLLTDFTDPGGHGSHVTYDGDGRLLQETDAAGGFQKLTRAEPDENTYTVARSTALGRTTTYEVEDLSTGAVRQTVTTPDGTESELLVETNGARTLVLPDGTVVTSQEGPDARFGLQLPMVTKQTYTTPGGLTLQATAARSATLSDPKDPLSLTNETTTIDFNGRTYSRVYDATSRTVTLTTPAGRQRTVTIDVEGRLIQTAVGGLAPVQFAYDDRGRVASLAQGARAYTFAYDDQGLLSVLTDPLDRTFQFAHDDAVRTTGLTLPDTSHIDLAYDANGNMVAVTPPGRSAHTFGFTAVDLVESYVPPTVGGGSTGVQSSYDLDGQLTQLTRGGASLTVGHDGSGRPSTLTHPHDGVTAVYDGAGRLGAVSTSSGIGVVYGYDGSLVTDTTWSGPVTGTVHRVFDDSLRLTSRTINGGNAQSYGYDADGFVTQAGALTLQRNAQNGLVTGTTLGVVADTRTHDAFGQWATYGATVNGAPVLSTQYTYDDGGRITQKNETIQGVAETFTYGYDAVGRLNEVKQDGATIATYTYDANGNRSSRTASGVTVNGTYDAQDRLTQYGTATHTYTGNGDLLSRTVGAQSSTYDYDVLGNLRGVTLPDGTEIEYLIDGRSRRVGKRIDGTQVQGFLYQDRLEPIAELDGTNAIVSTFVYGSGANVPDSMVKGGATYRIIADHLGSPRLVIDTVTGAIAQALDYDEFGAVTLDTNPGFQPFGFAGGVYDHHTKLVRFGARDYDAETGRWTTKDPIGFEGRQTNLYAYVDSDPLNATDQNGLCPGDYKRCRDAFLERWFGETARGFADLSSVQSAIGQNGDELRNEFWLGFVEISVLKGIPIEGATYGGAYLAKVAAPGPGSYASVGPHSAAGLRAAAGANSAFTAGSLAARLGTLAGNASVGFGVFVLSATTTMDALATQHCWDKEF